MRYEFYESEKSRRLARAQEDRIHAELESFKRNADYGTIAVKCEIKRGEPTRFVVTSEVSVKADDLEPHDE